MSFLGKMLDKSRLGFSKERHKEIQSGYNKALGVLGWATLFFGSTLVCGMWLWWYATHPEPARFFMPDPSQTAAEEASASMRMIELEAARSPRMSTQRVQDWVYRSLMDSHTMNFYNADQVLRDVRWVFRPDTYAAFSAEMTKSKGLVDSIKDNSLEMWITPTTDVRTTQTGQNGAYRLWKMEMRALLTFTGSTAAPIPSREVTFFVLVEEVPTTQNPYGLSIAQIRSQ